MVRCKCGESKQLYRGHLEAKAAMLKSGLRIYRCSATHGWHLTSKSIRDMDGYRDERVEHYDEESEIYLQMKPHRQHGVRSMLSRERPISPRKLARLFNGTVGRVR